MNVPCSKCGQLKDPESVFCDNCSVRGSGAAPGSAFGVALEPELRTVAEWAAGMRFPSEGERQSWERMLVDVSFRIAWIKRQNSD